MSITPNDIGEYLLKNNFLLTALEFFEELREIKQNVPILTKFFVEHKFDEKKDSHLVAKVPPNNEITMKESEEKIALLEYKLRMTEKENERLKEHLKSQFLEKDNKKIFVENEEKNQKIIQISEKNKIPNSDNDDNVKIKKRERRSNSLSDDHLPNDSEKDPKSSTPPKEISEDSDEADLKDVKSKSLGKLKISPETSALDEFAEKKSSSPKKSKKNEYEDIMAPKMNEEERQLLNFMIQTYLREENYKLTLITFFDESETDEVVNLDNILSSKYGLLFLYRYFIHSKPNQNAVVNEYEKKISILTEIVKNYKEKKKERKEKIEQLIKERDQLKVMVDLKSMSKSDKNGVDQKKLVKNEIEKSNVKLKKNEVKISNESSKMVELDVNFTSKVVNEIFHVLPGIIRSMKFKNREILVNLIKLLLRMNHNQKNNINLFSLIKKPDKEKRELVIDSLYDVYTNHNNNGENDSYFEEKVFSKIKKSVNSKYFERKILTVEFIVKFYPLFGQEKSKNRIDDDNNDRSMLLRQEMFFKILTTLSYDFNNEVRIAVLKGVTSILKLNVWDLQNHSDGLVDMLLKFLREEDHESVKKYLFSNGMRSIIKWLSEEERNLSAPPLKGEFRESHKKNEKKNKLLMLCSIVINEIKKNSGKKISNYCAGFSLLLECLKDSIDDVAKEVLEKDKRSVYFTWLLDNGISSIINLIISQDSKDIPQMNSIFIIKILKKFNNLFGHEFHNRILIRGFLLILESNNGNETEIELIRKRLFPFFIISICNENERKKFLEQFCLNVIEKKKIGYSNKLIRSIIVQLIGFYDCLNDPTESVSVFVNNLINLCNCMYDKHGDEIGFLLLDVIFPILIPTLKYNLINSNIINVLTRMIDYKNEKKSTNNYTIIRKVLKNLSNCLIFLELNERLKKKKENDNESNTVDNDLDSKNDSKDEEKRKKEAKRILEFFKYFTSYDESIVDRMKKASVKERTRKLNLINKSFDSLSNVVRKKKFIFEICQLLFDFSTNSVGNVISDDNNSDSDGEGGGEKEGGIKFGKKIVKVILNIYKLVSRFEKFERKDEIVRSLIIPNIKTIRDLYKDDNEIKKSTKVLLKLMKKKVRKGLFSLNEEQKLSLNKLNIFKKN